MHRLRNHLKNAALAKVMNPLRSATRSLVLSLPPVARAVSKVRGRMQERSAATARRRVESEAAELGIVAPTAEQAFRALRARLAGRSLLQRWPRKAGDIHIFLAYQHRNWEAVLPEALSVFGKVSAFAFEAAHSAITPARKAEINRAMLSAFSTASEEAPIDVVVGYLSGANTFPDTLRHMAESGAAIFNFSFDEKLDGSPLQPDGSVSEPVALAKVVDISLVSVPGAELKYAVAGGLAAFHPEAAQPSLHKPYDVAFRHDVAFAGACYGFRPHFIEGLRRRGIKVEAFGPGWPAGELPTERMVELYSASRINLGFGGIGHSRRLMCLKGRDFEVPMSGGLYLTQDNPELRLVFDVGAEIVTYSDEDDCAATIRALLADSTRAAAIRKAGRARCLRDHTYEARWSRVFEGAGILAPPN